MNFYLCQNTRQKKDILAKLEKERKKRYIDDLKHEIKRQEKYLAESKKRLAELEKLQ